MTTRAGDAMDTEAREETSGQQKQRPQKNGVNKDWKEYSVLGELRVH